MKKITAIITFFSALMFFSSAWALGRMGPQVETSPFYYTGMFITLIYISSSPFIFIKFFDALDKKHQGETIWLPAIHFLFVTFWAILLSLSQAVIGNIVHFQFFGLEGIVPDVSAFPQKTILFLIFFVPFAFFSVTDIYFFRRVLKNLIKDKMLPILLADFVFALVLAVAAGFVSIAPMISSGYKPVYSILHILGIN